MDIEKFIDKAEYPKHVQKTMPKSNTIWDCVKAFVIGGLICTASELLKNVFINSGIEKDEASCLVSITLIIIGSLLTVLGVYDIIGNFAGAGSIVPISGYANSITSSALEFKTEGLIAGLGTKVFSIAGPVLVYGICTSVIIGIIYCIFG